MLTGTTLYIQRIKIMQIQINKSKQINNGLPQGESQAHERGTKRRRKIFLHVQEAPNFETSIVNTDMQGPEVVNL